MIDASFLTELQKKLLNWYQVHKRDLPWRRTSDPYKIWLSEVILQQTRVAQGLAYYERFVQSFPTVADLAQAADENIMRHWQGLGYYSRCRNLIKTARYVNTELNGNFPDTYEGLLKLPGVGPYSAAAISSFAFKNADAVLDGNVFRVLSRLFADATDIGGSGARNHFQAISQRLISLQQPDMHNQAMMELGATVCTATQPKCGLCPLASLCLAQSLHKTEDFPVKEKKVVVKNRHFDYLVFQCQNEFLVRQRTEKDIWQNLFDFPEKQQFDVNGLSAFEWKALPSIQSKLTHRLLHLDFTFCLITEKNSVHLPVDCQWITAAKLESLAKPRPIEQFLQAFLLDLV